MESLELVEEKKLIDKNLINNEEKDLLNEDENLDHNNMFVYIPYKKMDVEDFSNIIKEICKKNNIIKIGAKYRIGKSFFYFDNPKTKRSYGSKIYFKCQCNNGYQTYSKDGVISDKHVSCKKISKNCSIDISSTKKWINFNESELKDSLPYLEIYTLFKDKFFPYWAEEKDAEKEFEKNWKHHFITNDGSPAEIDKSDLVIYTVHSEENYIIGFCEIQVKENLGFIKLLASSGGCGKSLVETVKNDNRYMSHIFLETASAELKPYYESLGFKNVAKYGDKRNYIAKDMEDLFNLFNENFISDRACFNLMVYKRK